MKNTISINAMEFHAHHGCFAEEKIIGTRFLVDLNLLVDIDFNALNDSLENTLNYVQIYSDIKEIMSVSVNLLETLCSKIVTLIDENYPEVLEVEVKIQKLNPPLGGKMGSVAASMLHQCKRA